MEFLSSLLSSVPFLTVLVVVANVLGVAMILPQIVHIQTTRRVDGLSPEWVGVGIAMNLWWVTYAVAVDLPGVLPVSIGALLLYGVIAGQLLASGLDGAVRAIALGAAPVIALPPVFLALDGWSGVGLAIGLGYSAQFAPAAITALRSSDLHGVAPLTWAMALVEALIWLGYGSVLRDPALVVGGAGGSAMAAVIVLRWSAWALGQKPRSGRSRRWSQLSAG